MHPREREGETNEPKVAWVHCEVMMWMNILIMIMRMSMTEGGKIEGLHDDVMAEATTYSLLDDIKADL